MASPSVIQGYFPDGRAPGAPVTQLPRHLEAPAATGGQPLPMLVRQKMESFFRASFADVRIHIGPQAKALGAAAFTRGSNIHFAPGHYDPESPRGQQLLAHELAHVVQQRTGRVQNPFGGGIAVVRETALEAEARQLAAAVASGATIQPLLRSDASSTPNRLPGDPSTIQMKWLVHPDRDVEMWDRVLDGLVWFSDGYGHYSYDIAIVEDVTIDLDAARASEGIQRTKAEWASIGFAPPVEALTIRGRFEQTGRATPSRAVLDAIERITAVLTAMRGGNETVFALMAKWLGDIDPREVDRCLEALIGALPKMSVDVGKVPKGAVAETPGRPAALGKPLKYPGLASEFKGTPSVPGTTIGSGHLIATTQLSVSVLYEKRIWTLIHEATHAILGTYDYEYYEAVVGASSAVKTTGPRAPNTGEKRQAYAQRNADSWPAFILNAYAAL